MSKIIVISLGSNPHNHITLEGMKLLKKEKRVVLRTAEHPGKKFLEEENISFETLDHFYENTEDFDQLNQLVTNYLISISAEENIIYAVPDAYTDDTVLMLLQSRKSREVDIVPGVGIEQTVINQIKTPFFKGVDKTISSKDLQNHIYWPEESLLITEIHSKIVAGEVKLWLMTYLQPEQQVYISEKNEKELIPIFLVDLDRQESYSFESHLFIPSISIDQREGYHFYDLLHIIKTLRSPEGCPWDREQTHESLRPYLVEEAYEAVAAIDDEDLFGLYDELGDVLLQVVLHSEIGRERGEFTIDDVITAISRKMIYRHPHVFAKEKAKSADEVVDLWGKMKDQETGVTSTHEDMERVSTSYPALLRAEKVQGKARKVGFDWETPLEALEKVFEEAEEVKEELKKNQDPSEELGDLLFACVNVARISKKSSELILTKAVDKFINRFTLMEKKIKSEGKALKDLTFSEMDVYWETGKNKERG